MSIRYRNASPPKARWSDLCKNNVLIIHRRHEVHFRRKLDRFVPTCLPDLFEPTRTFKSVDKPSLLEINGFRKKTQNYARIARIVAFFIVKLFSLLIMTFEGGGVATWKTVGNQLCLSSAVLYLLGPVLRAIDPSLFSPEVFKNNYNY